jgi:hypothetical protein
MELANTDSTSLVEDTLDWVVFQAEGMIAAQACVSVAEASFRLDEYAHRQGESKSVVARRIVRRELRFDP